MSSSADRRSDPRYGAHYDVRFSSESDAARAFSAFSINFSSGGLCVRTKTPWVVGEVVSLTLTIASELFELEGSVAWVRGEAVGIRFINVKPAIREKLETVAQLLAKNGPPIT
jgi:uncharacterized protein (TIGR02266 family)